MDPSTTEIYTLSLHDALPICRPFDVLLQDGQRFYIGPIAVDVLHVRSEEHTSELQSRGHLVCRLLLEKKKKYAFAPCIHVLCKSAIGYPQINTTCTLLSYHST